MHIGNWAGNWAEFYEVQTCPLLCLLISLLPVLDSPSHQEQNPAKPWQACACPDKFPEICNSAGARRIHHESNNSHSQGAAGAGWPSTAMPTAQLVRNCSPELKCSSTAKFCTAPFHMADIHNFFLIIFFPTYYSWVKFLHRLWNWKFWAKLQVKFQLDAVMLT